MPGSIQHGCLGKITLKRPLKGWKWTTLLVANNTMLFPSAVLLGSGTSTYLRPHWCLILSDTSYSSQGNYYFIMRRNLSYVDAVGVWLHFASASTWSWFHCGYHLSVSFTGNKAGNILSQNIHEFQ